MHLRGQGAISGERGYAMAALLVTIALMAVMMSVALPVWRNQVRREKEAELVFRGQQYVRAIRLYNMKTQSLPPSVDVLVQGRYLRKKWKDPITGDDFQVLGAASPVQTGVAQPGQAGSVTQPGQNPSGIASGGLSSGSASSAPIGGVTGVVSKSKDESMMEYQGHTHYNEWTFVYVQQGPGGGGFPGGRGGIGRPGGPSGNPGGGPFGGRGGRNGQPGRGTGPRGGFGGPGGSPFGPGRGRG